jgi:CHAT domain-containing protein
MSNVNYRNFDLKIWRTENGYCAQVQSLDAGEPSCDFVLPFSEGKLEVLLAKLGPAQRVRSLQSADLKAAKTLGGGLYKAVFAKNIGNSLSRSIESATQKGERLRIRLRLTGVPELANMPWEFLYDEGADRFLVLSYKTSIVRYLEVAQSILPLAVKPPLNMLVMASSPQGYDTLGVEKELNNLQAALGKMPPGLVAVERLEKATLSALQTRLSQGNQYHVFHFIGHGGFDSRTGKSVLVMEDENHQASLVDGQRLGVVLHNHNSLRLTVLNACEGALAAPGDVFSGVAQALIRNEMPAAIAMQFEISDTAAITFASGFYKAVARGHQVDAALLDARLAIFAAANSVEWGTPVLYLRATDGRIFDIDLKELEAEAEQDTSPAPIEMIAPPEPSSQTPPINPVLPLPPMEPKGILPLRSAFYVERPADRIALGLISYPDIGITLSIQASGQMGASSLLRRVIDAARRAGKQVAHINFQQTFNNEDFDNTEDFHRRFCGVLTDRLEQPDRVDQHWDRYKSLSIGDRCTKYVQYLLQSLEQHIVLAMDEVDMLIDTSFRSSFFGMMRSWHNQRAMDERFERLDLVLVTSLEPNQLIDDPNQSPFNVSGEARLSDFSRDEIRKLCDMYGVNPTLQQLEGLFTLIGGHPYLWQLSLHHVAGGVYTFDQLLIAASEYNGPYGRHLSSWYDSLQNKPKLRDALKNILSKREYDERAFLSLRRAGLVSRDGSRVRLRCKLYEDYFREQLYV